MTVKHKAVSKSHTTRPNGHSSPKKSNRKPTEESLREYQAILATAEEVAKIGSWKWDLRTQKVTWSDEMFRLFGVEREGFDGDLNRVISDRIHPDDVAAVNESNRGVLEEANPVPLSYRIILPDGTERTVWAQGKLIRDETGHAIALTGYVQDITERVKAEKKILQLKRLYATLSQVNQMIVRVKDRKGLFQTICDVAVQFGEFALAWVGIIDDASGDIRPVAANGLDIHHWPLPIFNIHTGPLSDGLIAQAIHTSHVAISEDVQADQHLQILHNLFDQYGFHSSTVIPIRLRDQTIGVLTLISREKGLFDVDEERNLLEEMGLDISFALDNMENEKKRRQTEEALRQSEERYRQLIESAPMAIAIARDGKYIYVNSKFLEIHHLQHPHELIDLDTGETIASEYRAEFVERARRRVRGLSTEAQYETVGLRKDGSQFPISVSASFVNLADGPATIGFFEDITERKEAEKALKESEERFSTAFFTSPVSQSIITQGTNEILAVNDACCKLFGYSREELIGTNTANLLLWGNPTDRMSAVEELQRTGRLLAREASVRVKCGEIRTVMVAIEPISWKGVPCLISSVFDITERKQAEDAVRSRSRQLEALLNVSRSLTESLDLPEVLQRITDNVADTLQVERVAIYLVNGEGLYLGASTPPLPTEMPEELRKAKLKDHPHIAQAVASGQVITIPDAQSVPLTTSEQEVRNNLKLRTIVYIPVITEQNSIGVLILGSVGNCKEFSPNEISLANAVSNQAALAITNAKLYEDLARQVKELETQIAERKQAEEALKRSEHVLRLFVEHSPASIAMFDRNMKYIVASQRFLTDYDLPLQDLTGRSHYDVFPEIPERWKEMHRRCLAGAIEKAEEDPFPRSNGKLDWVRWEIRPWYEEPEKIGGIILFSEVITERKQIQDELRQLNAELEQRVLQRTLELSQANRAKDEFLANMSHELRTPLNTVLGLSESLLEQRRGPLNEKQVQSIELIFSSGQHLLGLINDILEVSKIEAGKLQLNLTPVSIKELCESSLNFIKELALKKQITVEFNNESSISTFDADPQRLKQILINLLNNAVKFTPQKGRVNLQVRTNADEGRILFSIIDTGIGIAADDLKKLFTPFTQLDSSLSRQYAGTGLGLALVQKLTELHGGSVEVESTVGQGSRFTVILPLRSVKQPIPENPLDNANAEECSATPSSISQELGTILLAEDNMINSEMVSEYLTSRGYFVVTAKNGLEVLDKTAEFMPDLILMDIQMPKMDGLEATRRLRSDPRFRSTPIIALTALAMPGDKEHCLEAGVNEYFSKPASLKMLLKVVENLIAQNK